MRTRTYWVSALSMRGTEATGTVRSTSAREAAAKYAKKIAQNTPVPLLHVKVRTSRITLIAETFEAKPLLDD